MLNEEVLKDDDAKLADVEVKASKKKCDATMHLDLPNESLV
mgnify:CR=1 FL=1